MCVCVCVCVCVYVCVRVPFLVVGALLLMGERMDDTIDSAFYYGEAQVRNCPSAIPVLLWRYSRLSS